MPTDQQEAGLGVIVAAEGNDQHDTGVGFNNKRVNSYFVLQIPKQLLQ